MRVMILMYYIPVIDSTGVSLYASEQWLSTFHPTPLLVLPYHYFLRTQFATATLLKRHNHTSILPVPPGDRHDLTIERQ